MRNRISSSYKIRKSVLLDQGVSQKFPVWVARPKLGISELWSRWGWGLGAWSEESQLSSGQNPGKFWLFGTYTILSNSIFRVNIRVV